MATTAIIPARRRLERIHPRAWEHPADRAALAALQSVPGFDEALKKVLGLFGERGYRLAFQGDAVRVTPRQFPRLHRLWRQVHETLDAPDEYELFVSQSPQVNAGALGVDKPFVVLLSGSLRTLSDMEVENVMGHELGHVLSGHALYHTMLIILIELLAGGMPLFGLAIAPIVLALKEWFRKSELSADRAGLLAVQVPDATMRTMMRLAGGGTDEEMDLGEFLRQAEEYRASRDVLDTLMKVMNTLGRSHPFMVMRAALIRDWIEEGAYDRIVRGEYPRRGGDHPNWREDVTAGFGYYARGADGAAQKAGETARRMKEAFDRGFKGATSSG
jgi:Zn-dependent protease with chaperone function